MSYEGEHNVIPIRGIQRAGADNVAEDGAMNEIIGMEYKDGSYVPYAPEQMTYAKYPQGTKKIYVHKTSAQENVIVICSDHDTTKVMWNSKEAFDKGTYNDREDFGFEEIEELRGTSNIVFVGNMIVNNLQDSVVYLNNQYSPIYFKIDGTDLPHIHLRVRCDYEFQAEQNKSEYGSGCRCFNGYDQSDSIGNVNTIGGDTDFYKNLISSYAQKCIGQLTEKGGLTGWFLATIAYRLTNGSYVLACPPVVFAEPYVTNRNGDINIRYGDNIEETVNVYKSDIVMIPNEFVEKNRETDGIQTKPYPPKGEYSGITYIGDMNQIIIKINDEVKIYPQAYFAESPMFMAWGETYSNLTICAAHANILEYRIDEDIQQKYKQTIESVCVFMSEQISGYKPLIKENIIKATGQIGMFKNKQAESGFSSFAGSYWFAMKEISDILKELKDINLLYKVSEIKFVDIKKSSGWEKVDLKGKLGDNLRVQEILDIQSFSNIKTTGNLFVYNNRVHVFDYNQTPSAMYDPRFLSIDSGYGQYPADKFEYKKWRIIAKCNSAMIGNYILDTGGVVKDGIVAFSPLITYPNMDAYEIEFRIGMYDKVFRKIFSMYPKKELGLAVSWKNDLKPYKLKLTDIDVDDFEEVDIDNAFEIEHDIVSIPYTNYIKVSETSYLYFPAEQTYQIGKGKIIGLATLSISLSQDTFGRYPLLVFCVDGIYSMGVNSEGTGAYTNIAPFSREVCVNKNTICEVDGAVLFATDKGLMIATQQGVQEFCPHLNGEPKNLPNDGMDNGNGMYVYGNAIKHDSLIHLENDLSNPIVISKEDFIDYLQDEDTFVSYVSKKNKVIVYNAKKQYVYWIDIPSRMVTKLNMCISFDNNNYPTEEYYEYGKVAYQFAYRSDRRANTNCLLQTRPIKITNQLKTNYRVVARGFFNHLVKDVSIKYSRDIPYVIEDDLTELIQELNYEDEVLEYYNDGHYYGWRRKSNNQTVYSKFISFPVGSNQPITGDEIEVTVHKKYAGIYVLGSLDTKHWKVIGYKEKHITNEGFHDFGCVTERVSMKYLMIVLVGNFASDTHIDGIELTSNNKYNNKLK